MSFNPFKNLPEVLKKYSLTLQETQWQSFTQITAPEILKQEMVAMQQINSNSKLPVYGIVSNGEIWAFAQLEQQTFTFYKQRFDIVDLDVLYSVLVSLLESCKQHLTQP